MTPLAIDLFCGLGGWTEGLLAEGYDVVGFDIERHRYGGHCYPGKLVIQDVTTLHGSQFKDAALIVASPPCQAYSYRAMPWKRAKALPPPDNTLFETCFRIQREACAAAGRHIPLVVENVRGAQKWVGRARWNFGSFYLWGDVPALMPITLRTVKVNGFRFDGSGRSFQSAAVSGVKVPTGGQLNWSDYGKPGYVAKAFNSTAEARLRESIKNNGGSWFNIGSPGQKETNRNPVHELSGLKCGGDWFGPGIKSLMRCHSSKSPARKMASAMIAKIPLPLSRHIGAVFHP